MARPVSATSPGRSPDKTAWRSHVFVAAGFLLLAAALWWPLPLRLTTHVPGVPQWAYDEATFVWNIWYFKHAAIDLLQSPLHSGLIYYPLGVDLVLYTYNFYHVLASLPIMLAFGLPLASNVSLLVSTALSGYGAWLLVRYLLARERVDAQSASWAGLVAGAIFAFASNRSIYAALGHYDMVTTQWIPFYALALLRSLDLRLSARARRGAALLAGVFFAFAGLAEMITALFLAIFTLIVLLAHPPEVEGRARPLILQPGRWLPSLALTGGVAFLLWAPALVPILVAFLTGDFALKGWGEAIPLSTDLRGWFTPTVLHPLFGGDVVAELRRVQLRALEGGVRGFRDLNTVFLGWVTAALALTGWITWRRRTRIWFWTAVIFGLFTLGPFLQIGGEYQFDLDGVEATFPLPYALLHYLPIIKANRAPNRNSVVLMLALAVLAGYGVIWLLAKLRSRSGTLPRWSAAVPAFAAVLVIGEHLVLPLPLTDMRMPAVYAQIAADPRPVSVLQVPLGWRNSFGVFGPEATILQYYQSGHGKPMLGGNISRAPEFKMEYFRRLPWFQAMVDVQFGRELPPELLEQARAQAPELMALYDVGYVLLYPPVPGRPPYSDHWEEAWRFARETLPLEDAPFWAEDGIEAYRVIQPERHAEFALDLGAPATFAYRGEGWDAPETDTFDGESAVRALGKESALFVPLRPESDAPYQLALRVRTLDQAAGREQSVALRVNGSQVGAPQRVAQGWQELRWDLPAGLLADGLNRVTLEWAFAASPRALAPGGRLIGSTGVQMPVDVDLKAFADGGFIALFDDDGVQTDASAGRRGLNVTVLDARSGDVLSMAGYDTAANPYEAAAFADAIAAVPQGQVVLVASSGSDALASPLPEIGDALRSLGAEIAPNSLQGRYLALAGVKGAAPGTAAWVTDAGEAFLRVSLERDRRPVAAVVDWLRVERP